MTLQNSQSSLFVNQLTGEGGQISCLFLLYSKGVVGTKDLKVKHVTNCPTMRYKGTLQVMWKPEMGI